MRPNINNNWQKLAQKFVKNILNFESPDQLIKIEKFGVESTGDTYSEWGGGGGWG
jgi:hypothetical protein